MASETHKVFVLILIPGLMLIGIALLYLLARSMSPGETQVMTGFPETLATLGGVIVLGAFWLRNRKMK